MEFHIKMLFAFFAPTSLFSNIAARKACRSVFFYFTQLVCLDSSFVIRFSSNQYCGVGDGVGSFQRAGNFGVRLNFLIHIYIFHILWARASTNNFKNVCRFISGVTFFLSYPQYYIQKILFKLTEFRIFMYQFCKESCKNLKTFFDHIKRPRKVLANLKKIRFRV